MEYGTILQLTNATVVAEPPPVFARYVLRKSVDRLNTEVRLLVCNISSKKSFSSICFSFESSANFERDWKKSRTKDTKKLLNINEIVEQIFSMNNGETVWCTMFRSSYLNSFSWILSLSLSVLFSIVFFSFCSLCTSRKLCIFTQDT